MISEDTRKYSNIFRKRFIPPPILALFVLKLLSKKSMHGYQITEELNKIFSCKITRQIIYFILKKHEKANHVVSTWVESDARPRKKYRITEEGKRFLVERIKELKKLVKLLEEY